MATHRFQSSPRNHPLLPRSLCSTLALVSALAATTLTGCGIGTTDTATYPITGATLSGKVHGGVQPIVGSTIQLWSVGTSGYGSAASPMLGTHVVTTDASGFFSISGDYTCPSASTQVYLTATGGNPGLSGNTNNAAVKLVDALGSCGSLSSSTYIWVNEVTTAAAAYALAQYFTPTFGSGSTDSFGAPGTPQAQIGIANAFATVNNMVNTSNGTAVTTATITSALGNITETAESAKLNTIADILAACINSDGSGTSACATTLFPSVTPTGGTQPTDTLQAAVDMNLNPTSNNATGSTANLAALYALQSPTSPYVGVASQPTDWTYGINYSAGTASGNTLMNSIVDIAADSKGNIWLINLGTVTAEAMAEYSPTGTPLSNPFNSGATSPASMASSSPRNLAIDTTDNVFAGSSSGSGYIFEYNNAGVSSSYAAGGQPYALAIDGSNNIWVGQNSSSAGGSISEFTGGVLAATNQVKYPFLGGASPNTLLTTYAAIATDGTFWLSSGTSTNLVYTATGMNPGTCTTFPCTTANDSALAATYTAVSGATFGTPWGVAAAPGGGMWIANNASGNNTIALCYSPTTCTSFGSATSLNAPRKIAVDGAGRAWVANRGTAAISEFSSTGAVLSPASGTVGFAHSGIATGSSITLDPSGNVWIGNNTAFGATSDPDSIFELVGAAAPTVTPISLALKTNAVGQKP